MAFLQLEKLHETRAVVKVPLRLVSFPIPSHASIEEPCRQSVRVFQVLPVSLEASNPLSAKEVTGQAIASSCSASIIS